MYFKQGEDLRNENVFNGELYETNPEIEIHN